MHSEVSMPLDVPKTPHLTFRISRYWSHPLYPALATASLSNITVGFPHLCSLQLTVDRLAPYCSSACSLLLFSQYWGFVLPLTFHLAALGTYQSAGFALLSPRLGLQLAWLPWPSLLSCPFSPPLYRRSLALLPTLYCTVRFASGLT